MHRNHHPSSKCTGILPVTHECTEIVIPQCTDILSLTHEKSEIIIPQVNAPESYPLHINSPKIVTPQVNAPISYPLNMNAPTSSSLKWMHRNLTPHTWMLRNRHFSGKCTDITTLTQCTEIVTPQVDTLISYPSHINAPQIILPRVNAPKSCPSHMNAPKLSLLR